MFVPRGIFGGDGRSPMASAALRRGLFWLLRMDAEDIKWVLKFVHDLHPPFPLRPESAVQALQYLAGRDGGCLPGGMIVGQFLALVVDLVAFVIDVEKISGHAGASRPRAAGSTENGSFELRRSER
jgi:hypothetical protein